MIRRRNLLAGAASLAAFASMPRAARAAHPGKTVGAIRWDLWYAIGTPGNPAASAADNVYYASEASLAFASDPLWGVNYQSRAPSCATAVNSYTVDFSACNSQSQIDTEITAAHNAGLDYWAYDWYDVGTPANNAWALHQSSSIKSQMNWCLIFQAYAKFVAAASSPSAFLGYFAQTNYQNVLTNRPLIYVLPDTVTPLSTVATGVTNMRNACSGASLGNPYIVLMSSTTTGVLSATGADAIGSYSPIGGPRPIAGTYSTLVSQVEGQWDAMRTTGQNTVPTAVTGFDRRPLVTRPLSYQASTGAAGQRPFIGNNQYFQAGTPSAIAAHVTDMLTWLTTYSAASPAQTGLIYSWNEHAEGGSTLNSTLGGGNAILNAVAGVL